MCGIAGFLLPDAAMTAETLCAVAKVMTDAVAHRGPDDAGIWIDAGAGIALGHRRLSIVDLSSAGHQPMASADGRFMLSFNGEIYNFREIRAELEALGHGFRGHSDTEVLLAAVRQWGLRESLRRCNGMLALALWDKECRTLTLARDRLGKKPLYYACFGGTWMFASELKALLAHPAFRREIDRGALATYLRFVYLPAPYCIFNNVRKLPAASLLVLSAGMDAAQAEPEAYWSVPKAAGQGARSRFAGNLEEATDELAALLSDAVGKRMIADVSLGALLSGGIDSTLIVSLMQALSDRPVKTFCIGFHEAKVNEAGYAAAIARRLGTDHTELYLSAQDCLALVPQMPQLFDEPFADPSQIPTYLVSRLARQSVTVALSGDGGDELFAGYAAYPRCLKQWETWSRLPAVARHWTARLAAAVDSGQGMTFAGSRHARKILAKLADRGVQISGASPVAMLANKRSAWHRPGTLVPGGCDLPTVLTCGQPIADGLDPLQAMQQVDIEGYLADDILVKVDRASMAVALEVRSPLLDYRIVEFALSLPPAMKLGPEGGKLVLRNLLRRHVPEALWERRKAGFGMPVAEWLRGPLRDWAETLLDERRLDESGLLSSQTIRQLWRQHLLGTHNRERILWALLMFQAWHEHWCRGAPSVASSSGRLPSSVG
jgi:asparagine synthase (glutamine-hydrolysing)